MLKKILSLSFITLALYGCSNKTDTAIKCDDNTYLDSVKQYLTTNLQNAIQQNVSAFSASDYRQFIDTSKISSIMPQFFIEIQDEKLENIDGVNTCKAKITLSTNDAFNQITTKNSPLIYGGKNLNTMLQDRLQGSNINIENNRFIINDFRFTPQPSSEKQEIKNYDDRVSSFAQTIATYALPYTIKDSVIINGKSYSITEALKLNNQETFTENPVVNPADILEKNLGADIFDNAENENNPTEVLTPSQPVKETFPDADLKQAKTNNQSANSEIQSMWNKMDKTIQQSLLSEQQKWIQSKTNSCRKAAAQANSNSEAEYLQLQCDTRMTNERIQYLRGFVIN